MHPQQAAINRLQTSGLYHLIRNPLALSADLMALGVLLMAPSWLALTSLVINVASYEWKIQIEEDYLRQIDGTAYTTYCAETGRYLPKLFRRHEHQESRGVENT